MNVYTGIERRRFGRREMCKPAFIQAEDCSIRCVVADLSECGARLSVREPHLVPPTFKLFIAEDDLVVPCRVVRRTDSTVGVEFLTVMCRASHHNSPRARRIREGIRRVLGGDQADRTARAPRPCDHALVENA